MEKCSHKCTTENTGDVSCEIDIVIHENGNQVDAKYQDNEYINEDPSIEQWLIVSILKQKECLKYEY